MNFARCDCTRRRASCVAARFDYSAVRMTQFAAPNCLPDRGTHLARGYAPKAIDKMGLNSLLLVLSMRIMHEIREMEKARGQIFALNRTL